MEVIRKTKEILFLTYKCMPCYIQFISLTYLECSYLVSHWISFNIIKKVKNSNWYICIKLLITNMMSLRSLDIIRGTLITKIILLAYN